MPTSWTARADGELLAAARRDPEAFAELYRRYEPVVATFLVRQSRDAELAADLTAETFAAAFVAAGRFRDTGAPAAGWLLGIARNLLLTSWRRGQAESRARRRLGVSTTSLGEASLERLEALLDAEAAAPLLDRALQALPETQREAVKAYVLEEQPYAALAQRLGVEEATVRQRVSRGLARMRTTLEGAPR
ncbi:MAG: polymerase, sigma-24 subunit, subfamily [Conexibacter sp.]|nr:polymerase, sigma-24 subunit, subfamily [Conexibacter sp.]